MQLRLLNRLTAIGSLLVALACVGEAGAIADAGTSVRFTSAPQRVLQGHTARVAVAVQPANARCTLSVRYKGGSAQSGLKAVTAMRGRASWTWKVPGSAPVGAGAAKVSCGRAGSATRTIVVVGDAIPVSLRVLKQGFSIRPNAGRGTQVSYGVVIANQSPNFDAREITVLVNFVMAGDVLIGSATSRIGVIGARESYGLGGMVAFPAAAPIERLEVVIQVGDQSPPTLRLPGVANVRVLPGLTEPSWVGSVEGEIVNDTPYVLKNARLSVVVLDTAGNVLGGGTGSAVASLPVGTRQFFKVTSGLRPIPFGRSASALISSEPVYA